MSNETVVAECPKCGEIETHTVDNSMMVLVEKKRSPATRRQRNSVVICSYCGHEFSVRF